MGILGGLALRALLLLVLAVSVADASSRSEAATGHSLAVLDPVNLHNHAPDREFGEILRRVFAENESWRVIPRDTMRARFRDYKMDAAVACHEFQCSFDAGNVLAAEFVIFGSITPWGGLYAYTLNITHVRSSQVVWSRVGEVLGKQAGDPAWALGASLRQIVSELDPAELDTRKGLRRGLITVLDLSPGGSTPSRVMAERVATHLYASRNFDIMSLRELDELLAALDMRKSAITPTDSGIYELGGKMDVTHLVYSRLTSRGSADMGGEEFSLQLALYDIAAGKKVRDWPSQATSDFRKVLEFENKFFSNLFKIPEYDIEHDFPKRRPGWAYAGAGVSLVASAVMGYLAWSALQEADEEYARFRNARSRDVALESKAKVEESDREAVVFGAVGGLSLLGAGVFMVISF